MTNESSEATAARFPLTDLNEISFAHHRYLLAFESAEDVQHRLPPTSCHSHLTPNGELMVPMIIEAPLNTVEVFNAIFKPAKPFKIYTARHVARGPATVSRMPGDLDRARRLYDEYTRFQGRLEREGRAISFVCLPFADLQTVRLDRETIWPVCLHWLSIP